MAKTLGPVALKLGDEVLVKVRTNTTVKDLLEQLDKACKGGRIQDADGFDVIAHYSQDLPEGEYVIKQPTAVSSIVAVSDVLGPLRKFAETVAKDVYKRLKIVRLMAEAANVVPVVEATSTLTEANNHVAVAFQLGQRVKQLQSSQTKRSSWVLAAVGSTSVEIWHIQQGCQSRRTGLLGLSPDTASPGLQALVRLYYSNPQRLGYVFAALPGTSSRAADVFSGSIEEMPVVLKTSACMNEEIEHYCRVKELGGQVCNLPEVLGTAQHGDRSWLVTPYYGLVLASLRSPTMIVDATRQAADAIHFLAMNGHIHGNVSAHNISYQGGKATLIDLATLRLIDQVRLQSSEITGTPAFMSLAVLSGQPQSVLPYLTVFKVD
ncbi:hypothetical protein WJX82_011169 [Trebouxia sp. C0006]